MGKWGLQHCSLLWQLSAMASIRPHPGPCFCIVTLYLKLYLMHMPRVQTTGHLSDVSCQHSGAFDTHYLRLLNDVREVIKSVGCLRRLA